ncbi:unnamed protein product, partial [Discosporangium mesarthrocarpum]
MSKGSSTLSAHSHSSSQSKESPSPGGKSPRALDEGSGPRGLRPQGGSCSESRGGSGRAGYGRKNDRYPLSVRRPHSRRGSRGSGDFERSSKTRTPSPAHSSGDTTPAPTSTPTTVSTHHQSAKYEAKVPWSTWNKGQQVEAGVGLGRRGGGPQPTASSGASQHDDVLGMAIDVPGNRRGFAAAGPDAKERSGEAAARGTGARSGNGRRKG